MTAYKLSQILAEIIASGGGRMPVCIRKDTFTHPLESDGCLILDVLDFDVRCVPMMDDDGGMKTTKTGREIDRIELVLLGCSKRDEKVQDEWEAKRLLDEVKHGD